jgi:hypothetical protein
MFARHGRNHRIGITASGSPHRQAFNGLPFVQKTTKSDIEVTLSLPEPCACGLQWLFDY